MATGIRKKISNVVVWAVLGLLMFALAGFGVTSFNSSSQDIGRVGNAEISAEDYFRALDLQLQNASVEFGRNVRLAEFQTYGLDIQVRSQLISEAALLNEANEMGLSVGDAVIAEQIQQMGRFQGNDGFSRGSYEFQLERENLTPSEFEESIREDYARSILQFSVVGGVQLPDHVVDVLVAQVMERRDLTLARISLEGLDIPEPSQADLETYYDTFGEDFTRPEMRRITYAWLTPDMILDEVDVPEEDIQALYDQNADEYIRPERRIVERLVFPSLEEAEAARAALDAGDTDFDTLVEDRGLSFTDVDLGDVRREDLSDAAAEALFATSDIGVFGPLDSAFGPALFRVNAALDATEVTLEEVRDDLREVLAIDLARREIAGDREAIEDALAGGAEIEDLANDTRMRLGQIDFTEATIEDIAAYDNFRDAARLAADGDFPEALDLSDGGIFALRLDELVAPAVPPLDEIEEEIVAGWTRAAQRDALEAHAAGLVAEMAINGSTLEDIEGATLETLTGIGHQDDVPNTPLGLVDLAYDLGQAGELTVLADADEALILRLDAIQPGNINDPQVAFLRETARFQLDQGLTADVYDGFAQAMEADVGLVLDQQVINAVHASFP